MAAYANDSAFMAPDERMTAYRYLAVKRRLSARSKILLKKSALGALIVVARGRRATVAAFSGCGCDRDWEQLGEFAKVLGCCCKVELVFCAVGTSKTQAVELQDAFEVREQHLDLLSLAM